MIFRNEQKPRIGVPYRTRKEELRGDFGKLEPYVDSLRRERAEAVVISLGLSSAHLEKIAGSLDGLLLPGSPADVNPSHFGAVRHARCVDPDPDRERTDFALLEHCLAEQKPVFAICFGLQSLNVFRSGTLIQDIPSELVTAIEHDGDEEPGAPDRTHAVEIEPRSRLAQMADGQHAWVNSSHHQSIREPGRNLRVVSCASDGIIEAVEWDSHTNWVMGVQWHPERMAEADVMARRLFSELVAVAGMRKMPARA
ncbi:MAG TPA: gamma-glutamyl-gamma-aminobutyrate hydrolase family protein [Candidatus Acidoferrum sp.]|nr:gamma-glutamyl-gamma-aminobutyrate hydrolase family protein [Candidatus Acidoferrum sp.]